MIHPVLRGGFYGALVGLGGAVFCLAVAALRALVAILGGQRFAPPSGSDARLLAFYVGGFVVAGVVAGAAGPLLPGRFGTYLRFAVGGMVVVLAIAIASAGSLSAMGTADWIMVPALGTAFGCAAAYGYLKQ